MTGAVQRTVLGGVPVVWVEAPPPYVATLQFRVGFTDEHLPIKGVTHIVEHLAIFAAGIVRHDHNGFVGPTETGIWGGGEPEEALAFVETCARALGDLPFDRLEAERRVLRAEASTRNVDGRLFEYRFGAAGAGLADFDELGLRWLDAEAIAAWSARYFTAGNAVLALSGPPPDGLDLGLPDGPRMPDPEVASIVPAFPAHVRSGTGGVVLSMYPQRSTALNAATAILSDRIRDRLRFEAALSYAPYANYIRMSADEVHVVVGSDCEDHHAAVVQDLIWRTVQELADTGATDEELDLHRKRVHEAAADPHFVRSWLTAAAEASLRGEEENDWMPELDRLDAATTAQVMRDALDSGILLAPAAVEPPADGFGPVRTQKEPISGGDRYRRRRSGLKRPKETVDVSDAGIDYTRADGSVLTLVAAELVCGIWFPDDSLSVLQRGGSHLQLYPSGWEDGDALIERLRDLVGRGNIVPCAPLAITTEVRRLAHASGAATDLDAADALQEVPGLLHEEEEPLVVCKATHGGVTRTGVLVVTSTRMIWLRIAEGEDATFREWPASQLRHVSRDWGAGFVDATVKVRSLEGEHKFDVPSQAKDQVVAAIKNMMGKGA